MMNKNLITIAIYSAIAGSALAISPGAFAVDVNEEAQIAKPVIQSTKSPIQAIKADEKITVTGSRLRRDSFSVATPLATMDNGQ